MQAYATAPYRSVTSDSVVRYHLAALYRHYPYHANGAKFHLTIGVIIVCLP